MVFAVLIVACLVYLGVRFVQADGGPGDRARAVFGADGGTADNAAEREKVMSQANQFVLRLNTYGPEDLGADLKLTGYAELVGEVISPKFKAAFEEEGLPLAEATVNQAGYARKADVFATGVETMDADSASVLVAGAFRSSYPDSNSEGRVELDPQPFRLQVKMVKIDGVWLADDMTPLTGEDPKDEFLPIPGTTDAPTDGQTDGQTDGPTSSPTTGAGEGQ